MVKRRQKPFGERIRAARQAAGLTQADAARAAGISQPYLADLERGNNDPEEATARAVRRLARLKSKLSRVLRIESL